MQHVTRLTPFTLIAVGLLTAPLALQAGQEVADDDGQTGDSRAQQAGETVDREREQGLMGYGTDGIAENPDSYSLGNRSMLGTPDGHSQAASSPAGDGADVSARQSAGFTQLDRDGDGVLSRPEADYDALWQLVDDNNDGVIGASEFSAFERSGD